MTAAEDAAARRKAWEEGGKTDYNKMVAEGVPGYQSTNPSITPGSGTGQDSPYANALAGATPSKSLYGASGSNPYAEIFQMATQAGGNPFGSVAGGASFNPFDPEAYTRGWGKTIQGAGMDPYANTPFMNYLGSLGQPISQNYLLNALAGSGGQSSPEQLVSGLQGAMGSPNMGMLQAGGALTSLRDLVNQYYNQTLDPSKQGMLAGLIGGWEENPNQMLQMLSSAMGGGLSGAGQGIMSYLNRLRGQWNLQDTDSPWVKYFFQNQMGGQG